MTEITGTHAQGQIRTHNRILAVIGSTGTGKSKLAASIAQAVGGEVINADAMQTYSGLDIATNKPSIADRLGVPHHMLGVWDPLSAPKTVRDFIDEAVSIIDGILGRGALPIVCGGTHYWVYSLIWRVLLGDRAEQEEEEKEKGDNDLDLDLGDYSYSVLQRVDPVSAAHLHPNDTRKIRRALEILRDTKLTAGEHAALQAGSSVDPLRYDATVLWLDCSLDVLDARLDARVASMLDRGLAAEVEEMRVRVCSASASGGGAGDGVDTENGLMQAIGFKELIDVGVDGGAVAMEEAVEQIKTRTRRYARRQIAFVRKKILPAVASVCALAIAPASTPAPAPPTPSPCTPVPRVTVYRLDATDASPSWETNVLRPALYITHKEMGNLADGGAVLASAHVPEPIPLRVLAPLADEPREVWRKHTCEACGGRVLNGPNEWKAHLRSKGHKHAARARARQERKAEAEIKRQKQKVT